MSFTSITLARHEKRKLSRVASFAWLTLVCNVAVVLWGAYVRATGSGAGCGNKWPVCGGDVLGPGARTQTIIEFTHRATSGVALVMVACLAIWCWRVTTKRDWVRYSAIVAAVLLANEALLGAALVLLGHVAQDQSFARVVFLCLHFANTLLLLAALALTANWLRNESSSFRLAVKLRELALLGVGLLATIAIGITGAVAALGDTLFPATTLRASMLQDFGPGAPALLRFRLLHPVIAVIAGSYVLWVLFRTLRTPKAPSAAAIAVLALLFIQIIMGVMNVLLLAPVWLQILHLLGADLLWITLVLASADLMFVPAGLTAANRN